MEKVEGYAIKSAPRVRVSVNGMTENVVDETSWVGT